MLLKYITLGIKNKEYYNYNGKPLPIRPISTYERDQALMNAAEGISPLIFDKVTKHKLELIDEEIDFKIDKNNYKEFLIYYSEIDYWTVYFAMKDFQDETFSQPDYEKEFEKMDNWKEWKPKGYYIVKQMNHIHKLAKYIGQMSDSPLSKLTEVLYNSKGQELATMIHEFNIPLASEAWELTPLQSKFIYYTSEGAPVVVKSKEDLPGIKSGSTLAEISKQLEEMGLIG